MKKLYFAAAMALMASAAVASPLSPDQARANAAAFLSRGVVKAPGLQNTTLHLAKTVSHEGTAALYLFTGADNRGLVVASASSEAPAVLGYVDAGEFDPAAMPADMAWWLQGYAQEIAALEAGQVRQVAAQAAPERASITPIMKTLWNQNEPYNLLTPTLGGQHCMTGCVATAMAQVLKAHEWPEKNPAGFINYQWMYNNYETLSLNLADVTLDWANMLDSYGKDDTEAQNLAVAELMRACGYATSMQYSLTASGTTADKIPLALYNNFSYDKNVHTLERKFFGLTEWEGIVYSQLEKGLPVIITGVSDTQGGHCFVADGYSADRYFHINWGWGGLSDGYFLLSALTPSQQGIGGSTSGFNTNVNICIGIQKPVEGSDYYYNMNCEGNFGTTKEEYPTRGNVFFTAEAFVNTSMVNLKGRLGVKLVAEDGTVTYVENPEEQDVPSYAGTQQYPVAATAFPTSGEYTVTPAFYCTQTGEWLDMPTAIDAIGALTLACSEDALVFTPVQIDVDLKATDIEFLTDMYGNRNFKVSVTLTNSGSAEFYGPVLGVLLNSSDAVKAQTPAFTVDIEPGESQELTYVTKWEKAPSAGTYNFVYTTAQGEIISEPVEVVITNISGTTSITAQNMHMVSGNGDTPPVVPSNDVRVAGEIACTSGYYTGTIGAYIFNLSGGTSLASLGKQEMFVKQGEAEPFEFKGSFGNGVEGTTYMISLFNGNNQLRDYVTFVLGEPTSVKVVDADAELKMLITPEAITVLGAEGTPSIAVYGIDGTLQLNGTGATLSLATLPAGTYIAVLDAPNGTRTLKFVR